MSREQCYFSAVKHAEFVKDYKDLIRRLELMHDRCITRNLQAAGLGGIEPEQEATIYGDLDPNARMKTENGDPMLMATVKLVRDQERQACFVSVLIGDGADVNYVDASGRNTLMYASMMGCSKVVKILFENDNLRIRHTDRKGYTALMYAAENGNAKVVRLFIKMLRKLDKKANSQHLKRLKSASSVEPSVKLIESCDTLESENSKRRSSWSTIASYLTDNANATDNAMHIRQMYHPGHLYPGDDILNAQDLVNGLTAYDLGVCHGHKLCVSMLELELVRRKKELKQRLLVSSNRVRSVGSTFTLAHAARSFGPLRRLPRSFSGPKICQFLDEDGSDNTNGENFADTCKLNFEDTSNVSASREFDSSEQRHRSSSSASTPAISLWRRIHRRFSVGGRAHSALSTCDLSSVDKSPVSVAPSDGQNQFSNNDDKLISINKNTESPNARPSKLLDKWNSEIGPHHGDDQQLPKFSIDNRRTSAPTPTAMRKNMVTVAFRLTRLFMRRRSSSGVTSEADDKLMCDKGIIDRFSDFSEIEDETSADDAAEEFCKSFLPAVTSVCPAYVTRTGAKFNSKSLDKSRAYDSKSFQGSCPKLLGQIFNSSPKHTPFKKNSLPEMTASFNRRSPMKSAHSLFYSGNNENSIPASI